MLGTPILTNFVSGAFTVIHVVCELNNYNICDYVIPIWIVLTDTRNDCTVDMFSLKDKHAETEQ